MSEGRTFLVRITYEYIGSYSYLFSIVCVAPRAARPKVRLSQRLPGRQPLLKHRARMAPGGAGAARGARRASSSGRLVCLLLVLRCALAAATRRVIQGPPHLSIRRPARGRPARQRDGEGVRCGDGPEVPVRHGSGRMIQCITPPNLVDHFAMDSPDAAPAAAPPRRPPRQ